MNVMIPGTAITQKDADLLAENMVAVAEAYDIKISEKVTSLIGLGAAVAIVELPVMVKVRNYVVVKRVKQSALKKVQQQNQNPNTVAEGEPMPSGEGVQVVDEESINYGDGRTAS